MRINSHGFSKLSDGSMGFSENESREVILKNRLNFLGKLNLTPPLITLKQIHSDKIQLIKTNPPHDLSPGDAIITDCPNIVIGVLTADCLPIILTDKKSRGVGVIHAGRVGSTLGITNQAVMKFSTEFNIPTEDIFPIIGPGIGKCCYEVETQAVLPFQKQFPDLKKIAIPAQSGKWFLDLKVVNKLQLIQAGIPEKNIADINLCTCCNPDYFSYRRDRTPKRILSVVSFSPPSPSINH